MWRSWRLTTLWAATVGYRDGFASFNLLSFGIWCRVVRWETTAVSDEHVDSIFTLQNKPRKKPVWRKQQTLRLNLRPEDEDDMFLWNAGWFPLDYTALYPRRLYLWCTTAVDSSVLGLGRFQCERTDNVVSTVLLQTPELRHQFHT
jgi:hypothetical protein